ncbi:unnamed protein product [Absidia cylindrospora]
MNEQTTSNICKICLEKDDLTELISPCKCSGSIKYVHPLCMKSWRTSLLESGRERDLYRCTLCHHSLFIKQQNPLRTLFNYKVARAIGTFFILVALLIPSGTVMKMIIHFSALLTKDPAGGYHQEWTNGTFLSFIFSCGRTAIRTILTNSNSPISHHVNYAPFAVCVKPDPISMVNSRLSSEDFFLVNSMVNNVTFYALFFPFLDDRFWRFLLCRLEHFHLGFFLFGSVANIWYTCHILSDMFDIVLMVDNQGLENQTERNQQQDRLQQTIRDHHQQQQHQRHDSDFGIHRYDTRLERMQRQGGKLIKRLLVTYCFLLVALFWIHFNLMAFVVSDTDATTTDSTVAMTETLSSTILPVSTKGLTLLQQQQQQHYLQSPQQSLNQFLIELPLWMLRWITLGVAVGSVMVKIIYPWLGRVTNCIDHETILSLPADDLD